MVQCVSRYNVGGSKWIISKCENNSKKFNKTHSIMQELELDSKSTLMLCRNDCMLFYKEHIDSKFCHICGASRWVTDKDNKS